MELKKLNMSELKKLMKNRNNRLMLVIFIIGIIIIILSSGIDTGGDKASQATNNNIGEEERLSEILSQINGAGSVSVMISYEDCNSKSGIGAGLSSEKSIQNPRGVIVVADGAYNPEVRNALKEATIAVMGVGANRVCVYSRN